MKNKNKQNKNKKDSLSVLDNYKCDGQYIMEFDANNNMLIKDEQMSKERAVQSIYKQI